MAFKSQNILTEAQKARRLDEIRNLFKDFIKVIKVVSMYPEGNPLPQSMRRNFTERLAQHIEEYGEIRVVVNRDTLVCDSETVYIDKSKEEALAALFFDTGITSFVFQENFDIENAHKLLDVIKTYINERDKSQDLATLFWESGISRFVFTTLEDIALAEYQGDFQVLEMGDTPQSENRPVLFGTDAVSSYQAIFSQSPDGDSDSNEIRGRGDSESEKGPKVAFRGGKRSPGASENHLFYAVGTGEGDAGALADLAGVDAVSFKAAEAAEAMGLDNLPVSTAPRVNTTLILNDELRLSEEDEREIRRLSDDDGNFDMWESTAELCKEMLHQDAELADFSETVTVCTKVCGEFLRAGKLWSASQLLGYMLSLESKIRVQRPAWADKLVEVKQTFAGRDRMEILGEALNLNPQIGSDELRRYLACFDWQALAAVGELLGELQTEAHREAVYDFLTATGRAHVQIFEKSVTDKSPQTVRGAIVVLSRIGDARAFGILKKAATNADRTVRLELITQMRHLAGPEVLEILRMAATDEDPEVRRAAISSLSAQQGPAAFDMVGQILTDPRFSGLSDKDQEMILVAYAQLGGEDAVPQLGKMIERMNPLGNAILSKQRRAAFEALAHCRSDAAERLLIRLGRSWRPDVKQGALAALKHRRELIFGGDHE